MYKSKSIATRLLLLSCISAVAIVASVIAFINLGLIPRLTDKALENQTSALAYSLKGILDKPEQWTEQALSNDGAVLDAFSNHGKNVATLFLEKNGRYVRVATTLKKEDGSRAINTALDGNSDVVRSLTAGREYSGYATLFRRPHMTKYVPVSFSNGVRGAVFVGIDYSSADSLLLLAKRMDYVALAVGVLSTLLLAIGFFFSARVERSHREVEDIFHTTQEGLFLLDSELKIGAQTSHALSNILGFEVQPGDNFLDLLKPSVSPKTFETAKEYIDLLLRHDIKERLVASLNPLDCIEMISMGADGEMVSRFLQIRFNRVVKAVKITHLLVTANDITRQVNLERELRESERRVQDQMSMMVHILQADPRSLQDYLGLAIRSLNQLNETLRTSNPKVGISRLELEAIARNIHQLKGDASALQLDVVTESLHALETLILGLQNQTERKSEDLLPIAVQVKQLYSEIGAIQDVIARLAELRGLTTLDRTVRSGELEDEYGHGIVNQWSNFAQKLAERHEKKVELNVNKGLELEALAPELREALNSLVNQFIRNALVHGVESPHERKEYGKSEVAQISVDISDVGDGTLELSFRDDGRGINPETIRQAAIRSGRLTPEAAKELNERQLITLIFESGMSTRETVDEDAGRGVGLDAVKNLIARMRGRIQIGTTIGKLCHFRVRLPLKLELQNSTS